SHRPKEGSTKAVILVGGPSRGTRFRPLSLDVPKPLFEVAGHPIIWHCISAIAAVGSIHDVYIIGYYDESVFRDFIKDASKEFPVLSSIKYLREYEPWAPPAASTTSVMPSSRAAPSASSSSTPTSAARSPSRHAQARPRTRTPRPPPTNFGCIVSDAHTKRVPPLRREARVAHQQPHQLRRLPLLHRGNLPLPSAPPMKRRLDRPARLLSYPSSGQPRDQLPPRQAADDDDDDEEGRKTEVIRLEQDILGDMADSKQFFVYETKDFWRQIKTAGSAVPANALYLQRALQSRQRGARPAQRQHRAPVFIHPTADIHPTAKLGPNVSIGPRAVVGAGARIKESIVLEDTEVKPTRASSTPSSAGAAASAPGPASRAPPSPIIKNGVKVQSITILGKDCGVGDEVRVQNCVCLPYKELKRDVANEVIM
ncbi:unnamed protein product, partial [Clonostachys rosea f. rosea IK726]